MPKVAHLMGVQEIRVRLGGISRQRFHQLVGRADSQRRSRTLRQGRVWLAEDVEGCAVVHRPDQAGRDADEA